MHVPSRCGDHRGGWHPFAESTIDFRRNDIRGKLGIKHPMVSGNPPYFPHVYPILPMPGGMLIFHMRRYSCGSMPFSIPDFSPPRFSPFEKRIPKIPASVPAGSVFPSGRMARTGNDNLSHKEKKE
jgi:hypothetical protein